MIAKGNKSKEVKEFKRYVGVATMTIAAINPTKEEHEKLFNTTLEQAPEYLNKVADSDGKEYPNARISVVFKPETKDNGIEMPLTTMSLFVQKRYRYNKDKTKVQVIDKYGRTTWANVEDVKEHKIPVDKNGNPMQIDKDYRPAFIGEEELTLFVKKYLWIKDIMVFKNNTWVQNPDESPENCECRFENLNKIFEGDFSEIKDTLGNLPTQKVNVMLGVRTDPQTGKLYQNVFTKKFAVYGASNSAFAKSITEMVKMASESGRVLNTEYSAEKVREYTVTPTTFTSTENTIQQESVTTPVEEGELPF